MGHCGSVDVACSTGCQKNCLRTAPAELAEEGNLTALDEPLEVIDDASECKLTARKDEETNNWKGSEPPQTGPESTSGSFKNMTLDVEGRAAPSKVGNGRVGEGADACCVVLLNRENGLLGLAVDPDDGETLVVSAVDEGLVQEWNERNTTRPVTVGDRIISVNGMQGSPMQLFDLLNEHTSLQLEVKGHSERSVTLIRDPPDRKFGLVLRHREGGNLLLVKEISNGIVEDWNRDHAGSEIRCGDRIVEVNNTRGRGSVLNDLVKTTSAKLDLTIIPIS
mmetsp:Transcript_123329/g.226266  ORF Transcript_123329/g.226266 Transcript_123329/m.226266 type:complete len:279 (-) Transcript_123329:38-874(-)